MKEFNEIFDALELILEKCEGALQDGKIDWQDVQHLIDLATQYKVFVEAVMGTGEIPTEFKNIDQVDALALGIRAFDFVKRIVNLVKNSKKSEPQAAE